MPNHEIAAKNPWLKTGTSNRFKVLPDHSIVKALISFYTSSIGKKWVVALTGLVLVGFVSGHLVGNLQIFLPNPEALNKYAAFLQGLGDLLWVIRGVLLGCLLAHIVTTVLLRIQNAGARPQKYAVDRPQAATIWAKTMLVTGTVVALFLAFHLRHFTVVSGYPKLTELKEAHDCYSMVIVGFQDPVSVSFYLVGLFLLFMHLNHGIQSFIQTLGLRTRNFAATLNIASPVLAALLFLGYASIPVACYLGILKPIAH